MRFQITGYSRERSIGIYYCFGPRRVPSSRRVKHGAASTVSFLNAACLASLLGAPAATARWPFKKNFLESTMKIQ
ncbi:hypothetical protein WG66_000570 [Moniliophthora roreri]|nr:hypothetical protein WG66_000570 [Moniliophthora roreri]